MKSLQLFSIFIIALTFSFVRTKFVLYNYDSQKVLARVDESGNNLYFCKLYESTLQSILEESDSVLFMDKTLAQAALAKVHEVNEDDFAKGYFPGILSYPDLLDTSLEVTKDIFTPEQPSWTGEDPIKCDITRNPTTKYSLILNKSYIQDVLDNIPEQERRRVI